MEALTLEEILERTEALLDSMSEHEDVLYVAIELAHQLRDEIVQLLPDD